MSDDLEQTRAESRSEGVEIAHDAQDEGNNLPAAIQLPDGNELAAYEPRHPSPALRS